MRCENLCLVKDYEFLNRTPFTINGKPNYSELHLLPKALFAYWGPLGRTTVTANDSLGRGHTDDGITALDAATRGDVAEGAKDGSSGVFTAFATLLVQRILAGRAQVLHHPKLIGHVGMP